jgi:hypothetical protein
MATEPLDSLRDSLNKQGLNTFLQSAPVTSKPVYIDSSSNIQAAALPFPIPLSAGATDTSFSVATIVGQATGTANDLMHLTLVKGANATATIAGYYRVTVTDSAGVITTGDYYAPFYVLN